MYDIDYTANIKVLGIIHIIVYFVILLVFEIIARVIDYHETPYI
jgi:hypothetical protein